MEDSGNINKKSTRINAQEKTTCSTQKLQIKTAFEKNNIKNTQKTASLDATKNLNINNTVTQPTKKSHTGAQVSNAEIIKKQVAKKSQEKNTQKILSESLSTGKIFDKSVKLSKNSSAPTIQLNLKEFNAPTIFLNDSGAMPCLIKKSFVSQDT